MMTGYSRPAKGVKATEFTGARNDITMFGEFIRDYLDKYKRWESPKYLFGESYGTFRSAGLASELQSNEGIELNGIMLLGTVLDFQYISQSPTNDIGYCDVPADLSPPRRGTTRSSRPTCRRQSLEQVVQQSRDYAFGDYLTELAQGQHAHAGRAHGGGAEARAAHRRVAAVRAEHQPAHRPGHVSHRTAARASARPWAATTAA